MTVPLSKIYKSIILPVVLNVCETWSLTLKEEGIENEVLRRIPGRKGDEMVGGWRKLHDEEFHNLYFSPNIIRLIKSRKMW
jgi:hypothetical protein